MRIIYNLNIKNQFVRRLVCIKFHFLLVFFLSILICQVPNNSEAQEVTTVVSYQKISDTNGRFIGTLNDADNFGLPVASLGDLDGDSITDVVVGVSLNDDGGNNKGGLWVLFLNQDGTVKAQQKISDTEGDFIGILNDEDNFGFSITSLGDLDGDNITDIAVGAPLDDDDGGNNKGAVWVLFLNQDGTVKSHKKISNTNGNFSGTLNDEDLFGFAVTSLGDLDGDNVIDIAVGAPLDDDGGTSNGAVWVLFLNQDGTVKTHQKISSTNGNFTGMIGNDRFGSSLSLLGDLDGDSVLDLVVGAPSDDDGGFNKGAVWVLFLNQDGTVKTHQKISSIDGSFGGTLDDEDLFGFAVTLIEDVDSEGINDIVVGAPFDDDGGFNKGAVWLLFLNQDGTVKAHQKISSTEGSFGGTLNDEDAFGFAVTSIGDFDNNGTADIVAGAPFDNDGDADRGAIWVLFLNVAVSTTPTPSSSPTPRPGTTPTPTPVTTPTPTQTPKPGVTPTPSTQPEVSPTPTSTPPDGGGTGSGGDGGGSGGGAGEGSPTPTPTPITIPTPTLMLAPTVTVTPTPTPTIVATPTLTPVPAIKVVSSLAVVPVSAKRSGAKSQTATVTALDQSGNPMSGVDILAIPNNKSIIVTPIIAITNTDGIAKFDFIFKSFRLGDKITFVPNSSVATITQTQTTRTLGAAPITTYTANTSDTNLQTISSLTVIPSSATRSGTRSQTATVTALDQGGKPMAGVTILANTNGKRAVVAPTVATTESDGTARFEFKFRSLNGGGVITFILDDLTAAILQER